jgi:hypothetical protein
MGHPGQRRSISLIVLLGLLLGMGALLAWQRRTQSVATRGPSIAKYFPDGKVPTVPVAGPLETPDFLGMPPFPLTGDLRVLSADQYETARRSLGSVQELKKQKAREQRLPPYTIPVAPDAPTNKQMMEQRYTYRLRELEAYRRHTADQGAVRAAGEAFLAGYLASAYSRPDAPSPPELRRLGKAALEAGSHDPMLRAYAANEEYQATGEREPAERCWAEVLPELARSKYPRIVTMFVRFLAYDILEGPQKSMSGQPRRDALMVAIANWLQEESADPQWMDCVFEQLLGMWNMESETLQSPILTACVQTKGIDPAVVHALLGDWHIKAGWRIRGSGYADKVKPEAWAPFGEHMEKAAAHLQYSWSLRPEIPFSSHKMIRVCMAGFDNQYRTYDWFLRSVEARLDYWPIYWSLFESLRPRWGGRLQAMVDFSQNCLDTDRFDTFLPYTFLDFLPDIQRNELDNDPARLVELQVHPLLYQFLQRRERYRQAHPGEVLFGDKAYYRTRLALLLEQFDLPAEAAAEFGIDDTFDVSRMQEDHRAGMYLMRRLFAAQGDVRPRVLAFDEQLRSRWPADTPVEAIADLERELAALRPTANHPRAEFYYRHAERMLNHLQTYARGDWVHVDLSNSGLSWEASGDQWWFSDTEDELKIDRSTGDSSHLWARPLVHFAPPMEIEAVVEQIEGPQFVGTFGIQWARPGRMTQWDWNANEPFVGVEVSASLSGGSPSEFATFSMPAGQGLDKNWTRYKTLGPRRLSMKLWPQTVEAVVEGSWRIIQLPEPLRSDGQLQIGEPFAVYPGRERYQRGAVRISSVRVRKLTTSSPPPDDAPLDARETYWTARTAANPDDPLALTHLCAVRVEQQRLDEALTLARQVLERWPLFSNVRKWSGRALFLQRRYPEALAELRLTTDEPFDDVLALSTLGELLAAAPDDAMRNGLNAKGIAGLAASRSWQPNPLALAAQAAAMAELGEFESARDLNQQALALPIDDQFKADLEQRQKLYESERPFRLPAAVEIE